MYMNIQSSHQAKTTLTIESGISNSLVLPRDTAKTYQLEKILSHRIPWNSQIEFKLAISVCLCYSLAETWATESYWWFLA